MDVIFYKNGKIKESITNDYWKQGDNGTNVLNVKVWDDVNSSYVNLNNYTVELVVERPDRKVSPRLLMSTSAINGATISIDNWMTEVCGNLKMNVLFTDNSSHTKYSGIIYRMIGNSITPADQTITDTQYEALVNAVNAKASAEDVNVEISKITDGTTVVGRAVADDEGNVIKTTYATKNELSNEVSKFVDGPYVVNEAKIATKDKFNRVISSTYATKSEVDVNKGTIEEEAGYHINFTVDPQTYVCTVKLLNKNNELISQSSIDLPIEELIISAEYDEVTKKLILTLRNGQTIEIDVATIVSGLVPSDRQIAGMDLENDITKNELKTALDIDDIENQLITQEITTTDFKPKTLNNVDGFVSVKKIEGRTIIPNTLWYMLDFPGAALHDTTKFSGTFISQTTSANDNLSNGMPYAMYANHKYLICFDYKSSAKETGWNVRMYPNYRVDTTIKKMQYDNIGEWQKLYTIFQAPAYSDRMEVYLYPFDFAHSVGDTAEFDNFQYIDLTAMFGEGKEPTTYDEFVLLYGSTPISKDAAPVFSAGDIKAYVNDAVVDTISLDIGKFLSKYEPLRSTHNTPHPDQIVGKKLTRYIGVVSEIVASGTIIGTYDNIKYLEYAKPNNSLTYNNLGNDHVLLSNGFAWSENNYGWDDERNAFKIFSSADNAKYWIGFPKNMNEADCRSLVDGLDLYYELKVPVVEDIDCDSDLKIDNAETVVIKSQYNLTLSVPVSLRGKVNENTTAIQENENEINTLKEGIFAPGKAESVVTDEEGVAKPRGSHIFIEFVLNDIIYSGILVMGYESFINQGVILTSPFSNKKYVVRYDDVYGGIQVFDSDTFDPENLTNPITNLEIIYYVLG